MSSVRNRFTRSLIRALILCLSTFAVTYAALQLISMKPAQAALADCLASANESGLEVERCLRSAVRDLLSDVSTASLMAYVTASTSPPAVRNFCHSISHIIGEETYASSRSLEEALSRCTGNCRSGCIHGAVSAGVREELGEAYAADDIVHTDDETLRRIGKHYCSQSNSICHAIGHVAFISHEYELTPALEVCTDIATGFDRESCLQGVYMERTGTTDTESPFHNELKYELQPDYTYPCLDVAPEYRHACFHLLAEFHLPLLRQSGITEPEDRLSIMVRTCDALSNTDRAYCFEGIGVQSNIFGFDTLDGRKLQPLCAAMPTVEDRTACSLGVVPKYFFADRLAFEYCEAVEETPRRSICYRALFQWVDSMRGITADPRMQTCRDSVLCSEELRAYQSSGADTPDFRFGLFGDHIGEK